MNRLLLLSVGCARSSLTPRLSDSQGFSFSYFLFRLLSRGILVNSEFRILNSIFVFFRVIRGVVSLINPLRI